jgi:hypothetical protein
MNKHVDFDQNASHPINSDEARRYAHVEAEVSALQIMMRDWVPPSIEEFVERAGNPLYASMRLAHATVMKTPEEFERSLGSIKEREVLEHMMYQFAHAADAMLKYALLMQLAEARLRANGVPLAECDWRPLDFKPGSRNWWADQVDEIACHAVDARVRDVALEHDEINDKIKRAKSDATVNRLTARQTKLIEELAASPPKTMLGVSFALSAALAEIELEHSGIEEEDVMTILRQVEAWLWTTRSFVGKLPADEKQPA